MALARFNTDELEEVNILDLVPGARYYIVYVGFGVSAAIGEFICITDATGPLPVGQALFKMPLSHIPHYRFFGIGPAPAPIPPPPPPFMPQYTKFYKIKKSPKKRPRGNKNLDSAPSNNSNYNPSDHNQKLRTPQKKQRSTRLGPAYIPRSAPKATPGKRSKYRKRRTRRKRRQHDKKKTTLIKKTYYGRRKGKIIPIYGHKVRKKIGRHKSYIIWKTTKRNLPGKTYHGKFYKTRKAALKK